MAEEKLLKAITYCGLLQSRLNGFCDFFTNFKDSFELCMNLEVRLEKINDSWNEFQDVQTEIEELGKNEEESKVGKDFEDSYYNLISHA